MILNKEAAIDNPKLVALRTKPRFATLLGQQLDYDATKVYNGLLTITINLGFYTIEINNYTFFYN